MSVMLKITFAATVLAVAFDVAHGEPATSASYSKTEIKQMAREAHTAVQYRVLAEYFNAEQIKFEQRAQSEKQEWERRSQTTSSLAAKYPRPVDSSKNRFDYFQYEADRMNQQATRYRTLAEKSR